MVVFAASASLFFLDTWFLALITIRLAWRTAQTVTDAAQPGCAKNLGDPWVHRDTAEDTLGSRVGFALFLMGFGTLLGVEFH